MKKSKDKSPILTIEATENVDFRPLRGFCLIKPDNNDHKTTSGLIIEGNKQDKPQTGVIIAFGDNFINRHTGEEIEWTCKIKDRVIFRKYSQHTLEVDDETYFLVEAPDLLAVVNNKTIQNVVTSDENQEIANFVQSKTPDGKVNDKFLDIHDKSVLNTLEGGDKHVGSLGEKIVEENYQEYLEEEEFNKKGFKSLQIKK